MFNNKQIEVIKYDNQYKPILHIQEGAVRSGKSRVNHWLWLNHVNKFKNQHRKFLMTSTTLGTLKKNVLDDLEDIFKIDTKLNTYNEFELFGNTMICAGADKADSYKAIKGFEAFGWYGNEITEHHRNSVDQAFKRCSGRGSRIFWDTNPDSPNNYIKTNYIDKSGDLLDSGQVYIKSWHWMLDDNAKENNGFLPSSYIETLKLSTPTGMWYDRDILGLWVAASGMVYKDYNPDLHLITLDDYSKIYKDRIVEKWYSVDWGFEHYGVIQCWGVDYDGAYYLLDEVAEQHKDINYWIDIAKQLQIKYGRNVFYCDSARPDNIDMFNKSGINAMNAEKAVIEGISFVASLFKKNQIKICNHCENVRTTIYNYRWNDKTLKEEPIKEDDDGLDCMRYGIYSHFINGTNKLNWA